jgi:hypothetical protein
MVGVPHLTGRQKLYAAIVTLICESGSVDQRLRAAYRSAIASIDPQLDIPPELAGDFAKLRDELGKEFLYESVAFSTGERRRWAAAIATRIVAFYDRLARTR